MKTILAVVITAIVIGMLGYIFGPMLIKREIASLKSEMTQLQDRLKVSGEFIKAEEEARQATGLGSDTRLPDVVKTVNRLAAGQKSIEDLMQVRFADFDARLAEMKAALEGGMKKLARQADEASKLTSQRFEDSALYARIEDARIRLIKIKSELTAKNIGVAKGELDLLSQALDNAEKLAGEDTSKKAAFERLQGMVKEIKTEMDSNLVAATDRIDLLWHELAKVSPAG